MTLRHASHARYFFAKSFAVFHCCRLRYFALSFSPLFFIISMLFCHITPYCRQHRLLLPLFEMFYAYAFIFAFAFLMMPFQRRHAAIFRCHALRFTLLSAACCYYCFSAADISTCDTFFFAGRRHDVTAIDAADDYADIYFASRR